jgi:subtilisin family serine protease
MVRRFGLLFTILATTLFACAGVVLAQSTGTDPQGEELVGPTSSLSAGDVIPDRYIVVFNDDVSRPGMVANELAQELDLKVTRVYRNALKGFAARVPSGFDLSSALSTDSRVKLVAQDRVVEATAQTLPTGIDRIEADNSSTNAGNGSGSVDEDIAIIDTGIAKHPDLNIAGGRNCVGRDNSDYSDGNGHGTHVAGTAAAKDNDRGVVGVAPGARLWAVRVLNDNGSGIFASLICGIDWVTDKGTIEVANMSLGATVPGADAPLRLDLRQRFSRNAPGYLQLCRCRCVLRGRRRQRKQGLRQRRPGHFRPGTHGNGDVRFRRRAREYRGCSQLSV